MQEEMDGEGVKRAAKGVMKNRLEAAFLESWRRLFPQLPAPTMQHRFCQRKWRFDFAWPGQLVACEIDGGSFVSGGHNRPVQQQKDYEKANAAVRLGWRLLKYNTLDMRDPDFVAQQVAEVLTNAKEL